LPTSTKSLSSMQRKSRMAAGRVSAKGARARQIGVVYRHKAEAVRNKRLLRRSWLPDASSSTPSTSSEEKQPSENQPRRYRVNACAHEVLKAAEQGAVKPLEGIRKECLEARKHPDLQTPLVLAAAGGHTDCVRVLIRKKANINATDANGCTALIWATFNRHDRCVR